MVSPIDLVNQALDRISARTSVTGINPASPPNNLAAQVASRNYQTQVDAIFRAAHWNSARLQKTMTLLKAAQGTPENPSGSLPQPPIPWLYEYVYEPDCLQVRFVIPMPIIAAVGSAPIMTNIGITNQPLVSTAMPFVPAIDTDANGNQIKVLLTNAPRAQVVYTARIDNPDLWDASLQNAVIAALASFFVMPVTGDKGLLGVCVQMAVSLLNSARVSDGNEGITQIDVVPDWMQIRNTGSGWGWNNGLMGTYGAGCVAGYGSWGAPDGVSY